MWRGNRGIMRGGRLYDDLRNVIRPCIEKRTVKFAWTHFPS